MDRVTHVAEPEFTAEQVRDKLWLRISPKRGQTQTWLANDIGVSLAFLHDVLNGRREPTGKILDYLGLERIVVYRILKKRTLSAEGKQP